MRFVNIFKKQPPVSHPYRCEVIEVFTGEFVVQREGNPTKRLSSSRVNDRSTLHYVHSYEEFVEHVLVEKDLYHSCSIYDQYFLGKDFNIITFKNLDEAIEKAKRVEEILKDRYEESIRKKLDEEARANFKPQKVWR